MSTGSQTFQEGGEDVGGTGWKTGKAAEPISAIKTLISSTVYFHFLLSSGFSGDVAFSDMLNLNS